MDRANVLPGHRRRLVGPALAVALALAAGGGAWAFYLISDVTQVDAVAAKADVRIVESHEDGSVALSAKNAGSTPVFVRVLTVPEDMSSGLAGLHLEGDQWSSPDGSGWIFLSYALSPGDEACRFATVEEGPGASVSVYAEAVQSEGFATAQEAFAGIGEVA